MSPDDCSCWLPCEMGETWAGGGAAGDGDEAGIRRLGLGDTPSSPERALLYTCIRRWRGIFISEVVPLQRVRPIFPYQVHMSFSLPITLEVFGNYWDEKQIRVVQVYEMHTISRTSSGLIFFLQV